MRASSRRIGPVAGPGGRARFEPSPVALTHEETEMADLAYGLMMIGGFAVLALTLRALERL